MYLFGPDKQSEKASHLPRYSDAMRSLSSKIGISHWREA